MLAVVEGVAEVAAVTVGTGAAGEDHPADLSLVTRVPHHRTQLSNAVSKLTVVSIRARAALLPLVAELRLHHPLVVPCLHFLHLHCATSLLLIRHLKLLAIRVYIAYLI